MVLYNLYNVRNTKKKLTRYRLTIKITYQEEHWVNKRKTEDMLHCL